MKYIPLVNIKMGTKSLMRYSNGNTLPLTQLPFGMISFCPQSDGGSRWLYTPDFPYIEGIRLTHQPSPWIGDYGTVLFMPQNDVISDTPSDAWSSYRPAESEQRPDYMKIKFLRSGCSAELSPSERCAKLRITNHTERQSYLSCLPTQGNYTYTLDKESGMLFGTNDAHSQDDARDFKMYFVLRFDKSDVEPSASYASGSAFHIALKSKKTEVCVAISYISHAQALVNLEREIGNKDFDAVRAEAENVWEEHLSRIEIEPKDEKQLKTFYSCMYRAFLFPHKAYESDAEGNLIHYTPKTGKINKGVRYTDNGFWDTYRTVYPLFTLIARDEFKEMLEGFVNDYTESGYLPRWLSIGEVGCMPSTLIDAVIAEAATQGIADRELLSRALDGMIYHANNASNDPRYGRRGICEYLKYGYVPNDFYKESVNLTLDFAYGDWCIATVAKMLGREEIYNEYMLRAKSYKNLFHKETGFMRGKSSDGKISENFDPCVWGGDYTEASAWQSSLAVPHDIEGLCELYGGKDALIKYLDSLFAEPPAYRVHGYGGEIHEMSEMAAVDFGQCAISNQPSFHIPYMYAYLGQREKSEYWVEKICNTLFSAEPDGYPGDEDNGTMSAWYILSCLGRYRLCPGKDEWTKITPLVKSAKILGKELD